MLEDAQLVLRLQKEPADEQDADACLWYHPGFVNFTTWNLTLHRLLNDPEGERRSDGSPCICLQSACFSLAAPSSRDCFLTSLEAFLQDIDFSAPYRMDLFKMDQSADTVARGRMRLGYVRLLPLAASEVTEPTTGLDVWRGHDHENTRTTRKRQAPGNRGPTAERPSRAPRRRRASASKEARDLMDAAELGDAPLDMEVEPTGSASEADAESLDVSADEGSQGSDLEDGEEDAAASSDASDESERLEAMMEELEQDRRAAATRADSSDSSSSSSSSSSSDSNSSSGSDTGSDDDADDAAGAAARAGQMVRAAGIREEVFILDGGLGELHFSTSGEYLRAHCYAHPACRRQRTINASDALNRQGQGRPVGHLLAWLRKGQAVDTAQEHIAMKAAMLSYSERKQAREDFYAQPGAEEWADTYERARQGGERVEPKFVP